LVHELTKKAIPPGVYQFWFLLYTAATHVVVEIDIAVAVAVAVAGICVGARVCGKPIDCCIDVDVAVADLARLPDVEGLARCASRDACCGTLHNGAWCSGVWWMVDGAWCMVYGAWCMVHGAFHIPFHIPFNVMQRKGIYYY
jgi:hypothetical protein